MLKTLGNIIFLYSYDMSQMVLQEHMEFETHTEGLQILCDICDKKFSKEEEVMNHKGYRGGGSVI